MNNNPLISVVIPYYNRPEKLVRCVESVKHQSYKSYEIIIVDDCSETIFPELDCEYQYLRNKSNEGPGASRNVGMDVAKGEFIVFLDSDDFWHCQFLEKTINEHILYPQVSMVYSNGEKFDCNGFKYPYRKNFNKITQILPHILFYGRPWGTGACLWKSDAIKGATWVAFTNWEDYIFDIERAVENNSIRGLEEKLVYYDMSGQDKLSEGKIVDKVVEKCKGLNYISPVLRNSNFKDDIDVKRGISLHILNNLTLLLYNGPQQKRYISSHLALLKKWQNKLYPFFIYVVFRLHRKMAIRLVKHINLKVKNN